MKTGVIVWVVLHPEAALVLGFLAAAVSGATGLVTWLYYRHPGSRLGMIAVWDSFDPPKKCPDCNGWGVVDLHKQPFPELNGKSLQHLAFARGNVRSCGKCHDRGVRPERFPRPRHTRAPGEKQGKAKK